MCVCVCCVDNECQLRLSTINYLSKLRVEAPFSYAYKTKACELPLAYCAADVFGGGGEHF